MTTRVFGSKTWTYIRYHHVLYYALAMPPRKRPSAAIEPKAKGWSSMTQACHRQLLTMFEVSKRFKEWMRRCKSNQKHRLFLAPALRDTSSQLCEAFRPSKAAVRTQSFQGEALNLVVRIVDACPEVVEVKPSGAER